MKRSFDSIQKDLQWLEKFVQNGGIVQNGINWSNLVGQMVNDIRENIKYYPRDISEIWQTRLDQFLTNMEEKSETN